MSGFPWSKAINVSLAALFLLVGGCGGSGGGGGGDGGAPGLFERGISYLKATNTDANDQFGTAVAISADGNTLISGAYAEASNSTSIDAGSDDDSAAGQGAAYIYTRDANGAWSPQAYLKAPNGESLDYFGAAVAISGDGDTVAVGAWREGGPGNAMPFSGAVYVFVRKGTHWEYQAYLKPNNTEASDTLTGGGPGSIALSQDGSTLAVGARYEDGDGTAPANNGCAYSGAVYVFTRSGATWNEQAYIKAQTPVADDEFGTAVSLSLDGDTLAVGAPTDGVAGSGAAYIFKRAGSSWTQRARLVASNGEVGDLFGSAVSLSGDGTTLAVGAYAEGSGSRGVDGAKGNNNKPGAGAVYLFGNGGGGWVEEHYLKASNSDLGDNFGTAVSLSGDGDVLAVSAQCEQSRAKGIDGDQADDSLTHAGAAYVFERQGGVWRQTHYVKASNTDSEDRFGYSLSLSADATTLAVGAYGEAGAGTGTGGDPADDTAGSAGAVYVY